VNYTSVSLKNILNIDALITQLTLGSAIISLTIFIEVFFIYVVINELRSSRVLVKIKSNFLRTSSILTAVTLWLLAAFSIATWLWAIAFYYLECFPSLEESLYFAMVAFTSLGFGDIILPHEWRLFSGMIAANGLLLFGLNTAILMETLHSILTGHLPRS
jgi:hypothetical protein